MSGQSEYWSDFHMRRVLNLNGDLPCSTAKWLQGSAGSLTPRTHPWWWWWRHSNSKKVPASLIHAFCIRSVAYDKLSGFHIGQPWWHMSPLMVHDSFRWIKTSINIPYWCIQLLHRQRYAMFAKQFPFKTCAATSDLLYWLCVEENKKYPKHSWDLCAISFPARLLRNVLSTQVCWTMNQRKPFSTQWFSMYFNQIHELSP